MSVQTIVYHYNQRQKVIVFDSQITSKIRYEKVYSKELTVVKGVDNLIEFSFLNQEQKPVNLTGKIITCRIIDYLNNEILIQKTLSEFVALNGLMTLLLTKTELDDIDVQRCFYTLELDDNTLHLPVYVDSDAGSRGIINIRHSTLPKFNLSKEILIPTHIKPVTNTPSTYYSSSFNTEQKEFTTFQFFMDNFTGNYSIVASSTSDFSTSYNVMSSSEYVSHTGTTHTNIQGYHPYLKVKIVNQGSQPVVEDKLSGDIVKILYR